MQLKEILMYFGFKALKYVLPTITQILNGKNAKGEKNPFQIFYQSIRRQGEGWETEKGSSEAEKNQGK